MHFVDLTGAQILANHRHSSPDADVFALGRFFRLLQSRLQSVSDEVKCSAARHREWRPRVVREHKHGRILRRLVAPPPFPRIARPRSPNRPEHIPAQDPRANVLKRLRGHIVVDPRAAAACALHLSENFGRKKPAVELGPPHPEWILQILSGPGAEPVNRNRKRSYSYFAHCTILRISTPKRLPACHAAPKAHAPAP